MTDSNNTCRLSAINQQLLLLSININVKNISKYIRNAAEQNCQSVRLAVCAAHVALVAHGIVLPTIFASANRLATSAISWCTEFDLPACCQLPVASCLLLFAADDVDVVAGGGTVAVVIAVAAACCCCCYCCCCASGKMSATWQHAWLANECQTYWTVANVSDWQAMHTHQQHSNTLTHIRLHSSGSFRWCCTCFSYVAGSMLLPAAWLAWQATN